MKSAVLIYLALGFACMGQQTPPDESSVQHFQSVQEVKYPWGWIRWLMNAQINPSATQTFGIVEILPGQRNSLHMHPNCEELLYVISGSCEKIIGKKKGVAKGRRHRSHSGGGPAPGNYGGESAYASCHLI